MNTLKITAVSYLNTFPFVYGLRHSGILKNFELSLEVPSLCAKKLLSGETDFALVPIAALYKHPELEIYTDYCIGCNGPVKTVLLLSQNPIEKIENIYLDFDSITSVNLIKILCKFFWKINPAWVPMNGASAIEPENIESIVAIGDKTFELKKHYTYSYDLGEIWKLLTGLPFVFACWAGRKGMDKGIVNDLNSALSWGVNHISESIDSNSEKLFIPKTIALKYLQHDLSFILDEDRHKAMHLFYNYLNQLSEKSI